MDSLSPAANAFWGDIIRRVLSFVAAALVTHGFVTQGAATAYEQELVGVILGAGVTAWGNRTVYWQQITAIVGRVMPAGSTHTQVAAKVSELADTKSLPSVLTPANVTPSLVKP